MTPYVVRQGDYLAQLAFQFGFDPDAVWNDPNNADLKKLRGDPNILFPGDILQLPASPDSAPAQLTTGSTNNFTSTAPTVTLTVKFVGDDPNPYASQAYSVVELPALTGLSTDGTGLATFAVPVNVASVTVVFAADGESYSLAVGQMDPIDTLSGVWKRLQNLGYIGQGAPLDPNRLDLVRAALLEFKLDQAPPSSKPPASSPSASAPASTAPTSSPPPSSSPPASAPASTAPTSSPPPSSSPPASRPPSSSAAPASSAPPSSPPTSAPAGDGSGLSDDGTVDDDTKNLLLKAHGC